MINKLTLVVVFIFMQSGNCLAKESLNVYAWGGEIPEKLIHKFEKEEGIKVNFTTYDSNEMMFAKLSTLKSKQYDVVEPSSYYIEKMYKLGVLEELDHSRLKNYYNLKKEFRDPSYDHNNKYSIPYIWGVTGLFINSNLMEKFHLETWDDLWSDKLSRKLLLLDDSREIFSMALLSMGYSPNDEDPEHIQMAFEKLRSLLPKVKLFANVAIQALVIDEDVSIGMIWNGDAKKIIEENSNINFVYPKQGFILWVDCFAILKDAPHKDSAYKFIDFMLRAQSAKIAATEEGFAITNSKGIALLPEKIQKDLNNYPSQKILARSYFQRDVGAKATKLYAKLWQQLKMYA